jgi:tyrosyl-tRNA synthetase
MKTVTDQDQIDAFLSRGVENVFPSREFLEARLNEGKPLTMYFGIDPTGPTLHLGHAIALRKLRDWQSLGHKVILLIGDFTGMIGDPTDKSAARKQLTRQEVTKNAKKYKEQASRFVAFEGKNKAELRHNSEWSDKLKPGDMLTLASHFTVQQLLERDMFQDRLREHKPIYTHELLYPLFQGNDSVAMGVDGEIGGNDQTFNMLVGRSLMKEVKSKEKFVLAMKLLVDPTGKKMGKSEGNMITFEDSADDMFGKVMSWGDGMIVAGFELLTDVPQEEIVAISKSLIREEANPRDLKARLAMEIVDAFVEKGEGAKAAERFNKLFQKHETPEEMETYRFKAGATLLDVLVGSGLVESKSEARRQMEQGGVKLDGKAVTDITTKASAGVLQKGKRHFVRLEA